MTEPIRDEDRLQQSLVTAHLLDQPTRVERVAKWVRRYDWLDFTGDGRFSQDRCDTAEAFDKVRATRHGRLDDKRVEALWRIPVQWQGLNGHRGVAPCGRGQAVVDV